MLSFHVDYWNKLGWRDPYSSEINTRRQYEYAKFFPGDGVYTPQAIVNGSQQTVGSNEKTLNDQLSKLADNKLSSKITLRPVLKKNSNVVDVRYKFEGASRDVLNIAILQKTGSSQVHAGENKGDRLNHVNIVRSFKTVQNKDGVTQLGLPSGANAHELAIVAYTQSPQTMKITGATRMMDLSQQ